MTARSVPSSRPAARGPARRPRSLLVCGLAAAGAAGAGIALAGDDPSRGDPRIATRWTKDEVVRATVSETTETRIEGPAGPGGAARTLGGTTRIEATFARRCLDAGDDGTLRRSLVRIDSFVVRMGDREDRCLEGALVETGPDGVSLLSAPANPSRLARGWLRNRFAKDGRGFAPGLEELGAKGEVGVGDSWEAPPTAIALGLARGGLPVPLEKRNWKYTVTEATPGPSGPTLRVAFDEKFDVQGEASASGTKLVVGEGSFVRVRGTLTGTPGLWHRTGRLEITDESELRTSARGMSLGIFGTASESETWDRGGERPELPAVAQGAVAPRRIGGEEPWTAGVTIAETGRFRTTTVTTPVGTDGKEGAALPGDATVTWAAEIRCAAAEDGDPQEFVVTIGEWRIESEAAGVPDESLADSVVRVTAEGWRLVEGGAAATDAAKAWLEGRFGGGPRKDDPLRAAVTPVMHAAPGTSWATDPMDTTAALAPRFGFPIDPGTVNGKGTLTSLEGAGDAATAALEYEIDGTVSCAPGCGGAGAGQLKGSLHVTGRASGPAARWTREGSFEDRTEVTSNLPALMTGEELRRVRIVEERKIARTLLGAAAQEARERTAAGLALLAKKDPAAALGELTRATAADPGYARAWSSRARARLALKDDAGAVEDATKALSLDPRSADAVTARASARHAAGDLDGAVADFTRWTELAPRNARAWYFRARARNAKGDAEGALADFTAAVDLNPKYADALTARGNLHLARSEYERAIEDYGEVVDLRPDDPSAWCNRANARSANREFDAALEDAEIAVGLDEKHARAWFTRAIARGGKGDTEGQAADCTKALELDPSNTAVRSYRAGALDDLGRWDESAADWTLVLEKSPKSVAALCGRARARARAGDTAGALEDCARALAADPESAEAVEARAEARLRDFDEDGAVRDWTLLAERDPKHANARFELARAKFLPGAAAGPSIEALREALLLGRRLDYGNLWLFLARTQAGEEEAAKSDLAAYWLRREARENDEEESWYEKLVEFATGKIDEAALLAAADEAEGRTKSERLCEAAWYAGVRRALRGETAEALALLDRCLATGVREFTEHVDATRWRPALAFGAVTVRAPTDTAAGARRLTAVDPKGPAARAGLAEGDVVVSLDGAPLVSTELPRRLLDAKPGMVVRVTALRAGKPVEAEVKLAQPAPR